MIVGPFNWRRRAVRRWTAGLAIAVSLTGPQPAVAGSHEARVVAVSDGDTLVVQLLPAKTSARVRLLGIDAPEVAHGAEPGQEPWGSRAHAHLQKRLLHQRIRLVTGQRERDRYGRLLAYVYLAGRCLNLELVTNGLALAYLGDDRSPLAQSIGLAERTARAKAIGIWQLTGGLKERPGDFRRWQREGVVDQPF